MPSKNWRHSEGICASIICCKKSVVSKLAYKAKSPFIITVDDPNLLLPRPLPTYVIQHHPDSTSMLLHPCLLYLIRPSCLPSPNREINPFLSYIPRQYDDLPMVFGLSMPRGVSHDGYRLRNIGHIIL